MTVLIGSVKIWKQLKHLSNVEWIKHITKNPNMGYYSGIKMKQLTGSHNLFESQSLIFREGIMLSEIYYVLKDSILYDITFVNS